MSGIKYLGCTTVQDLFLPTQLNLHTKIDQNTHVDRLD